MTIALTKVTAYGVEVSEPLQKQFYQHIVLEGTGANTDVDYDIGDAVAGSLGTFWTAVGATAPGTTAIKAIRDAQIAAKAFQTLGGLQLAYVQADVTIPSITTILSAASAGGSATESMTVTGLLTTDEILAVTQFVDGAGAAVGILAYGNASGNAAANNALSVTWNADPGAGAKVKVAVSRSISTVQSGTYQLSAGALANVPNLLFLSGNAPTTWKFDLCWLLNPGIGPIECEASA